MRNLPELMFLNSLPVDREALDEEDNDAQMQDAQQQQFNAINMEANNNGTERVQEMPDEEDDSIDGDATGRMNNLRGEINQDDDYNMHSKMDTSQLSSKSIMRDASMLAKNID